jgi:hypothetical protein
VDDYRGRDVARGGGGDEGDGPQVGSRAEEGGVAAVGGEGVGGRGGAEEMIVPGATVFMCSFERVSLGFGEEDSAGVRGAISWRFFCKLYCMCD